MSLDKPGPVLDASLAKAFGWAVEVMPGFDSIYLDVDLHKWVPVPKYSTTWNGMQLVVEEMQKRCRWFGIEKFGERYRAIFRMKDRKVEDDWIEYVSDTVPHAVCMAALSALEGQADET